MANNPKINWAPWPPPSFESDGAYEQRVTRFSQEGAPELIVTTDTGGWVALEIKTQDGRTLGLSVLSDDDRKVLIEALGGTVPHA